MATGWRRGRTGPRGGQALPSRKVFWEGAPLSKGKERVEEPSKTQKPQKPFRLRMINFLGGFKRLARPKAPKHIPGSPFCRGESSLKSPQSGFWCLWEAQKHPKNTGCVTCVFRELSTPVILQSKSPVILQWRRLQGSQFFLTTSS